MFASTNTPAQVYRIGQSSSYLGQLINRFKAYRMYRKTVADLNTLTDRDLSDFGIDRMSINRVARKAVYGA